MTVPVFLQRLIIDPSGVGLNGEAIGPVLKQIIINTMLKTIMATGETVIICGSSVTEAYETVNVNIKHVR